MKISVGNMVAIPELKEIKEVFEIEDFGDDVVLYMTDGTAYGISQCKTINEVYDEEVNKLAAKWKI